MINKNYCREKMVNHDNDEDDEQEREEECDDEGDFDGDDHQIKIIL